MVFSSYGFIFCFLPIVLVIYFSMSKLKNGIYQRIFLVMASLFFYGYFNVSYLLIIIASIIVNYIIAWLMCVNKEKKSCTKALLITGVIFNLGLLGYFKYYDFFISNVNAAFDLDFSVKNLLLPLGISFFTFQQFSFLISVYKKEEKLEKVIDYSLFVVFFPQLVAGPIVLYKEMMPQFVNECNRKLNFDNLAKGAYIFCIGLFKKLVIADTVALFANNGFGLDYFNMPTAWVVTLAYTLQIYFDFSGYSDMAIGLGKMFNIDIPVNFNSPYISESINTFWRRWHITLGRALSTYVYIPLGGNRKGKNRTYLNLFVTFLASGIWHGAAWTFVIWGALNGVFVVVERIFDKFISKIPKFIRIATTFLIVNFLWVLFRADSFAQAMNIYKGMFNFSNLSLSQIPSLCSDGIVDLPSKIALLYIIGIILLLLAVVFFTKNATKRLKEFEPTAKSMIFTVVLFVISVIHLSKLSVFIYFNF